MSIEFTILSPQIRPAVYESLLSFWNQEWDADFGQQFLDWRYGKREHCETLVAMSATKCVGMIDTFIRPYFVNGEIMMVREPCDWFCLPDHRGAGLRLLKYLIAQGAPLLGVGLPAAALAIAPRLNWSHLADAREFILPLSIRRVAGAVLRKLKLGDGSIARHIPSRFQLRSRSAWASHSMPGGRVDHLALDEEFMMPFPTDYGLAPILTADYLRWLRAAPSSLGKLFELVFRRDGKVVGLTLNRAEPTKIGERFRIIHMHAVGGSSEILEWMLTQTVVRAIDQGAESVHCRTSCMEAWTALNALRFVETDRMKVMSWFSDRATPSGATNVTFLRGDDAMIPSLMNK